MSLMRSLLGIPDENTLSHKSISFPLAILLSSRKKVKNYPIRCIHIATWKQPILSVKFPGPCKATCHEKTRGRESESSKQIHSLMMTGIGCCFSPTLYSRSNLQTPWLVCETHRKQTMTGKPLRRRNFEIKVVINYVSADEAKELVAVNGFTVLDVRDSKQFERAHIKSCHHVPLFIENKDNDLGTIIKRQAHNNFAGLFYGLAFTKLNPDFVASVKSRFSPESKLLLVCQEGLRSTSAAQKLEEAGFKNVACVTSGLQSVKPGLFDTVGSTELKDAGKGGLVTIQGKISVVLGTVLISAFLFITFFPEQAEQLLSLAPGS